MEAPVFSLTPRPAVVLAKLQSVPGAVYWAAVVLVLVSLGVRLALSSALSTGYGYICFYPAVILAAFVPVASVKQRHELFGDVNAYLAENETGDVVRFDAPPSEARDHE